MVCVQLGNVKVIHGACDGSFNVAGSKVGAVRSSLVDAFNIPKDAIAFVDGNQVEMSHTLQGGSCLEFCKQAGTKGIVRMFTEARIRCDYEGIPKQLVDAMFKSLPRAAINDDGEQVWLEPFVDAWILSHFDDGQDKVLPPNRVRLGGQVVEDLAPSEWRLMKLILKTWIAGVPSAEVEHVFDTVLDRNAPNPDNDLKQLLKRINRRLTKQKCRASVHRLIECVYISL